MTARSPNSCDGLRVLMTADAVGGVWQYSLDLAAGLVHHGAHVLLAVLGPRPSAEQKRRLLQMPRTAIAEGDFALEWMADPWADVDASSKWLLGLQAQFGADMIHLNGYSHAPLSWQKPVIVVAHSCVFSWWQAVHGSTPGPEWNEYRRRVGAGLAAADAVVAPSAFMAGELQRHYHVAPEKVRVIHNFSRGGRCTGAVKQPYVLAAGRQWDKAKNIGLLKRIAPELDWEIRAAGSGQETGNSPDGSTSRLRDLGELAHADLISQMEQAAIFAHPALYEPFGLSILEAARARCCLVLADIASLRELWDGAAVFVNPRDAAGWIYELNALARNAIKRQRLGDLARMRAIKYRPGASMNKYWRLYHSLLERNGKEAAA